MNLQKQIIAGFLLLTFVFSGSTPLVEAKSDLSEQENQVQLLIKIQQLLQIILQLQEQIKSQNGDIKVDRKVYESKIYTFPHEEIYFVDGLNLVNSDGSGVVREVDQQIFDFFTSIVGQDFVLNNIDEWKVFYNQNSDIDAYVESVNNMSGWVVGVNREGFNTVDRDVSQSFADLFIHEYSHILLTDFLVFNQKFTNNFWTVNDKKNQTQIENAKEKNKFNLASNYYNQNPQRFVSDYATMSVNEDLAETFVKFIFNAKPKGETVKEKKVLAFYEEAELVKVRDEIRDNLSALKINID